MDSASAVEEEEGLEACPAVWEEVCLGVEDEARDTRAASPLAKQGHDSSRVVVRRAQAEPSIGSWCVKGWFREGKFAIVASSCIVQREHFDGVVFVPMLPTRRFTAG